MSQLLCSGVLDGDAGLLGIGLLDRKGDALPCTLALEREDVVEGHDALGRLEAEPTSEGDGDRNLEGGEASEGALEAAVVRHLLDVKVINTERRVETEADLLNDSTSTDLLVSELDEGGPLVGVKGSNAGLLLGSNSLVAVAEDEIDTSPVTLKSVGCAELRLLLSESLWLSLLNLELQLLVAVDLELLRRNGTAHGALPLVLPEVAEAVHAE